MKRTLWLIPPLAALAGCASVGPDYHLPAEAALSSPYAQRALTPPAGGLTSPDAPAGQWWRLYQDEKLNAQVERALKANTDLRAAEANLRKALAQETGVKAEQGPHAEISAAMQRSRFSGESYLINEKMPVINVGDEGFSAAYQFDLFGKFRRAEEAAQANSEAVAAAVDAARVTVAAETARAYLRQCSAGHALAIHQRQLALSRRSLALAQRQRTAGRLTDSDLQRAQEQVAQQAAQLPPLEAERQTSRLQLAALQGQPPAAAETLPACDTEPALSRPIPVGDGRSLLQRRPDVRQAERQLAGAVAVIGVRTAELYPEISFGLSAGYTGVLEDLGSGRTAHFGLGPLISWRIPDSSARARVASAEADSALALARFDGVVLNALRETETALNAYGQDWRQREALQTAYQHSRQLADDARRIHQAGRAPVQQSLDADRNLAQEEAALAAADARIAQDQIKLFLALGGGWQKE